MRVRIAEDDDRLARAVAAGLRRRGVTADVTLDGSDALDRLAVSGYDVVVLDRDLPGVRGDDICRFDFTELAARIRVLARRPGAPAPGGLGYRDLRMDPELRIVTRAGRRLALTPKELTVLECLLNADGRPVPAGEPQSGYRIGGS